MKLRGKRAPVPGQSGEEDQGEASSEDEQAPSPRRGTGKLRKPRTPGGQRITPAESKRLNEILLSKFIKPVTYEDTILSPAQVAEVIAACIIGVSEKRVAVFNRDRVAAQWKLILTVTWDLDLKKIKADFTLDKAKEAAVGLGGSQAQALRELEGKIEEDKEKLVEARGELSALLVAAAAEIHVEHDVVINAHSASASFDSLLACYKILCTLNSGHDQDLFELKESCEKTLMTLASKLPEFATCQAYTESAGLSTTAEFRAQHIGELGGAGGATTRRPGTKKGREGAELDVGKLSLSQLTKTLASACTSAFGHLSGFISRLGNINILSEGEHPTPRKKAAMAAPPSDEELQVAEEARRSALETAIASTRALRDMQAKRNTLSPDNESVRHLSIIVPPHNQKRSHAVDVYLTQQGGDPITPLMEELLVHTLAPESTRSRIEQRLHEKAKVAGRYSLGGLVPRKDVAAADEDDT